MEQRIIITKEQRKSASALCLTYANESSNHINKLAIIALALGFEFGISDEKINDIVKGERFMQSCLLAFITVLWNQDGKELNDEMVQPFIELKTEFKNDIKALAENIDWVTISRLWDGCLTKLDIDEKLININLSWKDVEIADKEIRPVSDSAFAKILKSYISDDFFGTFTNATYYTLFRIADLADPDGWDPDDPDPDHWIYVIRLYKATSNKENLNKWYKEEFKEDEDNMGLEEIWDIGKECFYKNVQSFMEEIEYDVVIKILNICWIRSCKTNDPFPSDQFLEDFDF